MHPFIETISVAGAIGAVLVVGIIVLTLFFRAISWLTGEGAGLESLAVRGILKKNALATVHLVGGETFEGVRLLGFTHTDTAKGGMPFDLTGMVILEDAKKQRYLVRAKNIRMILIPPVVPT